VRRRPPGDDDTPPLLPEECLDLHQALSAAILGSALVNGAAARRGRLRVGNVADLVLLDGDPFRVPDASGIGVDATVLAGAVVHTAGKGEM